GAWVLSDEVYRGAEHDAVESASFWGRYERTIVTGGLSKAYGLPGLRIGWIVAPPERIAAASAMKDYTTIAPATLSELIAATGLRRREELLARTRGILNARWPLLEAWAKAHAGKLHWTRPQAGAICFFGYSYDIDSWPFVDRLIRERGTMVVPGSHFLSERHLRIGFGIPEAKLRAGLAELDAAFAELG
ncbi:MAG: aminotransferase class I/II-fold pyridoxal phosphate-dependent enzyme, partial [Chloroflexota bacterium]